MNFMLRAEEAAFILRHAGAGVLATDSGLADLARSAAALDTQVRQFVRLPSEEPSQPAAQGRRLQRCAAKNPSGKLLKRELGQRYQAHFAQG